MPESGRTVSLWKGEFAAPDTHPLRRNLTCDVCVIGAGITGLTSALLLAQEGLRVAVLEDGGIGDGVTLRTTAHLASGIDDRYYDVEKWHGAEGARLAAESHSAAIDRIEAIIGSEHIDCDFRRVDGYLVSYRRDEHGREELERECAAAERAGLDVSIEQVPIASYDFGPAVRFPRQGQFHAGRYLAGLANAVLAHGAEIYTSTHAADIEGGEHACVVTKTGATVDCRAVIVATNTPINDRFAMHTKQAAYRTFVVASRMPRGEVPPLLLWDTLDPYHYVRTQAAGPDDWLIVGGEDRKTGQDLDAEPFTALFEWMRERFPAAGKPVFRWSGQIMEPHDGLAFIGANPTGRKNVYIASGDSGNGLTHGTIAGMLLTDLIMDRPNPWSRLYDPARKPLHNAGTFVRESANYVAQYRDFVLPGEIKSVDQLRNGDGAIIRRGLARHAVYRDVHGTLHEMSAVCPHLGCAVRWNAIESSWDCPCHGSRFAADGHVINGPANHGLERIGSERKRRAG